MDTSTTNGLNKSNCPSRMGKVWLDEEVLQLLTSIRNKKNTNEIANEHQRTLGGIISKLRGLAAEYYFNDKKSIDEIMKITNLEKDVIIDAIQKREYRDKLNEKKKAKKIGQIELATASANPILEILQDMNERLKMLQVKVDYLNEKINKPNIIIKKKPVVNEAYEFVD